jgi:hypothetical protein
MKTFAILAACVLAAGGATYFLSPSHTCPLTGCPVAETGGCCSTGEGKTSTCGVPCPACSTDCQECCATCEDCCVAGAQVAASIPLAASVSEDEECCAACCTPVKIATSAVVAGASLK